MDSAEGLIKKLSDNDPAIREQAAMDLGETGNHHAVEPLVKALEDNFIDVRIKAAEALGKLGDSRAVLPLARAIGDVDSTPNFEAHTFIIRNGVPFDDPTYEFRHQMNKLRLKVCLLQALQQIGPPAVEVLISVLRNESTLDLLREALTLLGYIGNNRAIDSIVDILEHANNITVFLDAAISLLRIGGRSCLEAVTRVICRWDKSTRGKLAKMSGEINNDCAVEMEIRALDDRHWGVRWTAVKALEKNSDTRVKEALVRTLKDEDPNVRKAAQHALK
jgi:HEAT repeat protein